MRDVLSKIGIPDHVGLAYDAWAPIGADGKVPTSKPDSERAAWFTKLAGLQVSPDYVRAFERWKSSFAAPGDRCIELALASRLLIGHGNTSAVDVGLTVHHTWGVPVIPGAALKGLLAHYVDAVYGPGDPSLLPWQQPEAEQDRARYQGVTWDDRRILRGPGEVYRALFGAPDAEGDADLRSQEPPIAAGAIAGQVVFHDALYVPASVADDKPYATDVLTVHQKRYYDTSGASWPSDYDDPNPVAFLTVRPKVRMLVALSGPTEWTAFAEPLLLAALGEWGVGGKTSSGYGRLVIAGKSSPAAPTKTLKANDRVEAVLLSERTKKGGWKAHHEPSRLVGPVQNSSDIPAELTPGSRITLTVASVNTKEICFRVTTEKAAVQSSQKMPKRK